MVSKVFAKPKASPGRRADTELPSRTTKAARASISLSRNSPESFLKRIRSVAAKRTGETRFAEWGFFSEGFGLWTTPERLMKMRRMQPRFQPCEKVLIQRNRVERACLAEADRAGSDHYRATTSGPLGAAGPNTILVQGHGPERIEGGHLLTRGSKRRRTSRSTAPPGATGAALFQLVASMNG